MNRGTVPDDGQSSGDMPLEMAEELDDLLPLDAAGVDLEVDRYRDNPPIIDRLFQPKVT